MLLKLKAGSWQVNGEFWPRRAQLIVRAHEVFRALAPHEAAILRIAADAVSNR